jgi:hypothetical protein
VPIFSILIEIEIVLSHILYLLGASVSFQVIDRDTDKVETATTVEFHFCADQTCLATQDADRRRLTTIRKVKRVKTCGLQLS